MGVRVFLSDPDAKEPIEIPKGTSWSWDGYEHLTVYNENRKVIYSFGVPIWSVELYDPYEECPEQADGCAPIRSSGNASNDLFPRVVVISHCSGTDHFSSACGELTIHIHQNGDLSVSVGDQFDRNYRAGSYELNLFQ